MTDKTLKVLLGTIAVNLTFLTVRDVGLFPTDNAPAEDRPALVNPFAEPVLAPTDEGLSSTPEELLAQSTIPPGFTLVEENQSFTFAEAVGLPLECATTADIEDVGRRLVQTMLTQHFGITDHLNRIQQDIAFFNR